MPKRYPVEFRRKVLDLIEAGRPVVEIAAQLGVPCEFVPAQRARSPREPRKRHTSDGKHRHRVVAGDAHAQDVPNTFTPNSLAWFEVATDDPDTATSFFADLFGWTFSPFADPETSGVDYRVAPRRRV